MSVDALVSCIARSSVAMVLTLYGEYILVLHEEGITCATPG